METKQLAQLPEIQAIIVEKAQALRSEIAQAKLLAAHCVRAYTQLFNGENLAGWIQSSRNILASQIDPLERELRAVERWVERPLRPGEVTDLDIEEARKYPLDRLITEPLRGYGRRRQVRCPFHDEKTASMVVYTDQNSFHCYGCGANGNAIDFVMKSEGLSFIDAVKRLSEMR